MREGYGSPIRVARLFAAVFVIAAYAHQVFGQAPPSPVPLWQLPPFDRITLINDTVHDIDPVRIAPGVEFDPELDTYVGEPGLPPFRELRRARYYRIRLQDDGLLYDVQGKSIRKIQYYEDLLLAAARDLLAGGKFDQAYDYLVALTGRAADWPGVLETRIEFHMEESEQREAAGDREGALLFLAEEKRLRDDYEARPGPNPKKELFGAGTIRQRADDIATRWFERELSLRRFGEARKAVARLERLYPDSGGAQAARAELGKRSRQLADGAQAAKNAGNPRQAALLARQAIEIVPDDPGLRAMFTEINTLFPVLRVGVEQLPTYRGGLGNWTRADERCADLFHVNVARLSTDGTESTFTSDILAAIEKSDINRKATLELKEDLVWPGDGKPVTVIDLERLVADSCRLNSPTYHPALERLLVNLRPLLPSRLEMQFDRPQFQPAAWLQIPFLRLGHDPGIAKMRDGTSRGFSGLGPFRLLAWGESSAEYGSNPTYFDRGKPLLRQITEIVYPTSAERLRALANKEVDMVVGVAPRHLEKAAKLEGVKLVTLAKPRIHLLQFNLRRRELRQRALRRAIDYAIDRQAIFAKLGVAMDPVNRPISGPLPHGSFGDNPKVEARPADLVLAKALVVGVRKELQTLPPLRLAHRGDETSRAACALIVADLVKAGLTVSLVDVDLDPSLEAVETDLEYRSYTVTDPVYDVITLLTRDNPTLTEHGSPWLRQKLVELVDVPNLSAASVLLPEVHAIIHDDAVLVPLWQWSEHCAVSEAVGGLTAAPPRAYTSAPQWNIVPRFPDSHWQNR